MNNWVKATCNNDQKSPTLEEAVNRYLKLYGETADYFMFKYIMAKKELEEKQ
jgi:hypothetical protein